MKNIILPGIGNGRNMINLNKNSLAFRLLRAKKDIAT